MIDGVLLRKSPLDNKSWVPIVTSYDQILESPDSSLLDKIYFWHLLHFHRVLGYHMSGAMKALLEFMCDIVCKASEHETNGDQVQWLVELYQDDTLIGTRKHIEAIALELSDFISEVLRNIIRKEVRETIEVVIRRLINEKKKSKYNSWKDFVPNLEELLLQCTGDSQQILSVLRRSYQDPSNGDNFQVIFGKEAVKQTHRILSEWKAQSEDDNESESTIFTFSDVFERGSYNVENSVITEDNDEPQIHAADATENLLYKPLGEDMALVCSERSQVLSLIGKCPPVLYSFVEKSIQHAGSAQEGSTVAFLIPRSLTTIVSKIKNFSDEGGLFLDDVPATTSSRLEGVYDNVLEEPPEELGYELCKRSILRAVNSTDSGNNNNNNNRPKRTFPSSHLISPLKH